MNFLNTLNINQSSTESGIGKIDIESSLKNQTQKQKKKDNGWRVDRINLLTKKFQKSFEMKGSSYVYFPLRSSPIWHIENDDILCFLWSILARLHPHHISHPNRVSNYRQYFDVFNLEGFDYSNGFRCSDVH